MSTIKFMDMNDTNMFPDLSSKNIKVRKTSPISIVRIENSSVCSSSSDISKKKTQPCKAITSGKSCPYGGKCNFAHSLEELILDDCLYKNKCYLVKFDGKMYTNAGSYKKCTRIHPTETKESFHKRCGTLNVFPKFPEKTFVPNMKCTKLCKNAYEMLFNSSEKKCDIENCTYAHSLDELNLLECSFGNGCRHVETEDGASYKNINLKKICVRRHPRETAVNLCHRRREYDVNLEKEEAEQAIKNEEALTNV